jgi:hypothetical protein
LLGADECTLVGTHHSIYAGVVTPLGGGHIRDQYGGAAVDE